MYYAIFEDKEIAQAENLRELYKWVDSERRSAKRYDQGQLGYTIYHDGKAIFSVKSGWDVTLQEADVSIRMYHTMVRQAKQLGLDWEHVTMKTLYDMATTGKLRNVRNVGMKTYIEIFSTLRKYIGWSNTLQMMFIDCLSDIPSGLDWLTHNFYSWGITD